jgi:hypothetical protein
MSDTTADLVRHLATDLYIGGKSVQAAGGRRFDVVDPATGQRSTPPRKRPPPGPPLPRVSEPRSCGVLSS